MNYCNNNRGYILLITVLVVGAVSAAIAVSLIWLGGGNTVTTLYLEQSYQAKALADACAEEALQQIRDSSAFVGTGSLTLGQGTCSYTVVNTGGTTRFVSASGTVGTVVRQVSISISALNPLIVISSWREV